MTGREKERARDYRGEKESESRARNSVSAGRLHICCQSEKWYRNVAALHVALVFDFQRSGIHTWNHRRSNWIEEISQNEIILHQRDSKENVPKIQKLCQRCEKYFFTMFF